ncbi:MAG: lysophospholipid acyltransferase family protein [Desulfuromonadales bacterium]|nr:lysophospholipid acyltransferase family protein [Desulfuromonadales bacterium]
MNDIKGFFEGTEYRTPECKSNGLSRLAPSLVFYCKAIAIVWHASRRVRHGDYDSVDWHDDSARTVKALEQAGCRLQVTGMEHLKGIDRPCIFIGNHMSTLETFVLPSLIMPHGFDLAYVVKRSLIDYPVFGDIVKVRDPVVVDRVNPREDLKMVMEEGARRLEQGRSLIIFPQHTRTVDFDPKQFNSIGIKLAKKTGATVVPIALLTWAWSTGRLIKDFGPIIPSRTIHFAFGEAMQVSGKGQEEQQRIVDFIQENLEGWKEAEG